MMPIGPESACQLRIEANGPQTSGCSSNDPRSIHKVAQEFESLLIGQMLKSMKLGELSGDGNGANASMMEFAQENLARLISQNGGIGMAHFLENALNQTGATTPVAAPDSSAPNSAATSSTAPGIAAPRVADAPEVGRPVPARIMHTPNPR